jgi:hypothetical protein
MASEEERQGGRSLGSAFSIKSVIKALSGSRHRSPSKTPPRSSSPEQLGVENAEENYLHTAVFPPEEFFNGMERQEGLSSSIPRFRSASEPDFSNLAIRQESDRIRSPRSAKTDERKVEASLASGIRYSEKRSILPSSEIRLNDPASAPTFSPMHALRDDPSPFPRFQREDTPVRAGDQRVEDYGRMYHHPNARDSWDHYSGYPSQDPF